MTSIKEKIESAATDQELLTTSQEIEQKFDKKKNYYNSIASSAATLQHWEEVTGRLSELESQHRKWKIEHQKALTSKISDQIIKSLESYEKNLQEVQEFLESIIPNESRSANIENLKEELINHIKEKLEELTTDIDKKITTGINSVLDLKAELGLTKNFEQKIKDELKSSQRSKTTFISLFILTLASIPIFLATSNIPLETENSAYIIATKAGVSLTLGFLSFFFFSQYKFYQLLTFRYTHLSGFLGGGATFIGQLINSDDPELKSGISKRLAELFIELDDITGLIKKNGHPAEISIDKITKLLDAASRMKPTSK